MAEKTSESKVIVKRINELSEFKKDFITDAIIGMANLSFRINFMKWFCEYRMDLTVKEEFLK